MAFSDWMVVREQEIQTQKPSPAMQTKGPGVDSEIKQVIVANMGKPKQARTMALAALAKKKQADPKSTPKDLQAIADVVSSASDQIAK